MARSADQFLQDLLRNITDYYTATYSTDTDLYKILQTYSDEFSSGSIALETVRDNTFVVTCEESQLYNNFGTLFTALKGVDQLPLEDRYLSDTSGSIYTFTPTVLEYREETTIPGTWTSRPVWPFSTDLYGVNFLGTSQREGVYWRGSLYSTCFMARPTSSGSSVDYIQLARYTPNLGWEEVRTFGISQLNTWVVNRNTSTIPFGLTTYKLYRGFGIYDSHESMGYFWNTQNSQAQDWGLSEDSAFSPATGVDRLNLYEFNINYSLEPSFTDESFHSGRSGTNLIQSEIWTAESGSTSTKGIEFNNKVYVGMGILSFDYWKYNAMRRVLNLEAYPQYSDDTTRTFPYLIEYDPIAGTVLNVGDTAQTTLTAYVNSGSWGESPANTHNGHNSIIPDWKVWSIASHGNRVYLHTTSGSILSLPASTRKNQLPAYNGKDWSFDLTAPSGSYTLDMHSYKDHLYALVKDDEAPKHRIAKFIHGLPTLSSTVGHWKFESNLIDSSTSANDLTEVNFTANDYTRGRTGPGITSMDSLNTLTTGARGAKIPAADATDFEMGTGDFTIELIVNTKLGQDGHTGIVHKYETSSGKGYRIGTSSITGQIRVGLKGSTSGSLTFNSGTDFTINDGKWHYIVAVFERSGPNELRVYLDGVLAGTVDISSIVGDLGPTSADLEIAVTINNPYPGLIDEICITKAVLSASDIMNRNYQVKHQDGSWSTEKIFTQPLYSLYTHKDRLIVSTSTGDIYYLDTVTDTWKYIQTPQANNEAIKLFVPSGSSVWAMGNNYWQNGSSLFQTTPWEYFFTGTDASQVGLQPTAIPGYRKQLDFLMQGAVHGGTVEGIKSAVSGLTLINPDIRESTSLVGWKLKTMSGSAAQISENIWKFNDYYTHSLPLFSETIARWKFDSSLEDSSESGNVNILTEASSTTYVDGMVELSGSASAVLGERGVYSATIADALASDFDMDTTDDFTIEVIAKFDNPGDRVSVYTIIHKTVTSTAGWALQVDNKATSTGGVRIQLGDTSHDEINQATTTTVNDGDWHYIVCVIDRTNDFVSIYIDGVEDDSFPVVLSSSGVTGSLENSDDLFVGDIDGSLDELCVTKRALTAAEIHYRNFTIRTARNTLRQGDQVRPYMWTGSHATFISGSIPQGGKIAAGYLITTTSQNNQVTIAPIYKKDLLWDLRRTL